MRQWIAIGAAVGLVAVTLPYLRKNDDKLGEILEKKGTSATPGAAATTRVVDPPPLADIDLVKMDDRGNVVTAPGHEGRKVELTLEPKLQRAANGFLKAGRVPEGAVVMADVRTGRVLVWASNVEDGPLRDIASEATAPTASVFKIMTGTALVEAGLGPTTRQCYSGGEHGITAKDMVDDKKRDKWCATLAQAMGRSLNTVFARLAAKNLDREKITNVATRFGYGQELPFDVKIAPSTLTFPDDDLGFARTAAGFWNSTLSPFEGMNIASTVANGGEMIRFYMVSSVKDDAGEIYHGPSQRQVMRHVMDAATADQITTMMESTVESGTSYKSFHDRNGKAYLPDVKVAGKTGTLTKAAADGPFYTWFVGFAPSRKPEVAIAVLAANHLKWRTKATNIASDMLRVYFAEKKTPGVSDPNDPGSSKRRSARERD
jgi:penicillin-binding protein A